MIVIENIQKSYQKQKVLTDCSFTVQPGSCVGIIGANGCGKTTLLSIMAGTQFPDSGRIQYYGQNITKSSKGFQQYIGYVPQENPLIQELSVMDNLKLWYHGKNKKETLEYVIEEFGLEAYRKKAVAKLSGGIKRRLSIACAMVNLPSILILDEPCVAVDLVCKSQIHAYLQSFKKKNGMIVMTTHDESELKLCDQIFLMNQGKLQKVNKDANIEQLILQTSAQD